LARKLYLTRVHKRFDGDTFFPEIIEADWKEVFSLEKKTASESELGYMFVNLERK